MNAAEREARKRLARAEARAAAVWRDANASAESAALATAEAWRAAAGLWRVLESKPTRPERIRAWVKREFAPKYVERVVSDLLDVATGNREGNAFERSALERIFPEDV